MHLVLALLFVGIVGGHALKGHLEPYGSHGPAESPIIEYSSWQELDPEAFYKRHVAANRPAIIRGGALDWPAYKEWTDERLAHDYGHLRVLVEDKFDSRETLAGEMLITDVVRRYQSENIFLVSQTPDVMLNGTNVFPWLRCRSFTERLVESNLWLSSGGTSSTMHEDADPNINCLLAGRKEWFFVRPEDRGGLYMVDPDLSSSFSTINTSAVDLEKYPKVKDTPYQHGWVNAGDCMYVPGVFPHHVRSFERNLAMTLLFQKPPEPLTSDCRPPTTEGGQPVQAEPSPTRSQSGWEMPTSLHGKAYTVGNAGVRWGYSGRGMEGITMGLQDTGYLKSILLDGIRAHATDGAHLDMGVVRRLLLDHQKEHLFGRDIIQSGLDRAAQVAWKALVSGPRFLEEDEEGLETQLSTRPSKRDRTKVQRLTIKEVEAIPDEHMEGFARVIEMCISHSCNEGEGDPGIVDTGSVPVEEPQKSDEDTKRLFNGWCMDPKADLDAHLPLFARPWAVRPPQSPPQPGRREERALSQASRAAAREEDDEEEDGDEVDDEEEGEAGEEEAAGGGGESRAGAPGKLNWEPKWCVWHRRRADIAKSQLRGEGDDDEGDEDEDEEEDEERSAGRSSGDAATTDRLPMASPLSDTFYSAEEGRLARELGHMKPLGWHRPPEGGIVELHYMPTADEMWRRFFKPRVPVVLRGAAKNHTCFKEWTDEVLKERFGDLEVRVEEKVEGGAAPRGDIGYGRYTIGHFVDTYNQSNGYIVSQLPDPMRREVEALEPFTHFPFSERAIEANLWLSAGGTRSILHRDAHNFYNCLLEGTKHWIFIEPEYQHLVPMEGNAEFETGGASTLDTEAVDMIEFPDLAYVPYRVATVHAGDCVVGNGRYLHQVDSPPGRNLAVAVLFADVWDEVLGGNARRFGADVPPLPQDKRQQVPAEAPSDAPTGKVKTLDDIDIIWEFDGAGALTMGNLDPQVCRDQMLGIAVSLHGCDSSTTAACWEAAPDLNGTIAGISSLTQGPYGVNHNAIVAYVMHGVSTAAEKGLLPPSCRLAEGLLTPAARSDPASHVPWTAVQLQDSYSVEEAMAHLDKCLPTLRSLMLALESVPIATARALAATLSVDPSNTKDNELAVIASKKVKSWLLRLYEEMGDDEQDGMSGDRATEEVAQSYRKRLKGTVRIGQRLAAILDVNGDGTVTRKELKGRAKLVIKMFSDASAAQKWESNRESAVFRLQGLRPWAV